MPNPRKKPDNKSRLKAVLSSPYFLPAATILPTILTYLFARRIRPQATSTREEMAKNIREKGIGLIREDIPRKNPLLAYMEHGTPYVGPAKSLPKELGTVAQPFPAELPVQGTPRILGNAPKMPYDVGDKYEEILHLAKTVGPHVVSPTSKFTEHLAGTGPLMHAPDGGVEAVLTAAQLSLKGRYPKGYILKDRFSPGRSHPMDETHNLVEEYNKFRAMDYDYKPPEWAEAALRYEREIPNIGDAVQDIAVNHPPLFAELIAAAPEEMKNPLRVAGALANPEGLLAQQNERFIAELRMHSDFMGTLVRRATVPRHNRLAGARALMGIKSADEVKWEDYVQKNILDKMRPEDKMNRLLSMDIGIREDGTPVLIESNPAGWSGFLMGRGKGRFATALTSHRYLSELAGQDTALLAGLKAIGAGAAGAGAAYGAQRLAGDEPTESEAVL